MPDIALIKTRISATQNTRKITRAMQMVAASRMKVFQGKALAARAYAWSLLDGLKQAHASFADVEFGRARKKGPLLFVLLTSDKGLCGALNSRLIEALFSSPRWKEASSERMLVTVGKKSLEAARRRGITVAQSFEGLAESMNPLESLRVTNEILGYWERGECSEIILISPHFVNAFTTHVTEKTYLPFNAEMILSHLKWRGDSDNESAEEMFKSQHVYYEPTEGDVVEVLSLQLAQTLFVQAFFELKASEYSSRMVSMKSATEAADDFVTNLTLDYNKVRQGLITQQLAELSSGMEALG